MYFGLIKLTSDCFHSKSALRRFSAFSLISLSTWVGFMILHYRPPLRMPLRAQPAGDLALVCLGMALAFSWLGLTIGMTWYFWNLDANRFRARLFWVVIAVILSQNHYLQKSLS